MKKTAKPKMPVTAGFHTTKTACFAIPIGQLNYSIFWLQLPESFSILFSPVCYCPSPGITQFEFEKENGMNLGS